MLHRKSNNKFENILTKDETNKLLDSCDAILPKKRKYYIETMYSHYKHTMYVEPLDETRNIIAEKYPEYLKEFDNLKHRTSGHMFNMFIMKKELLNEYCNWLFDILFELEKRVDISKYNDFHKRFYGRVSELLLDVYFKTNKINYKEVKFIYMEKIDYKKKVIGFIKAKFMGEKYGKSF